jgi:predicted amidohydrolase
MKISVAQTLSIKGDIQNNIDHHKKLVELAIHNKAEMIIFPELSITGYEPALAKGLAIEPGDTRFDDFQTISDINHITIGIGMPTKSNPGIHITMIIFQPNQPRQTYSKQHLHSDEYPYFVHGQNQVFLTGKKHKIALAICYELSVPAHSENAYQKGTDIYIASVAKTTNGVDKAIETLSGIAGKYSMAVLMANCTGLCDGAICGGKSSVWNNKGILAGQLNDTNEGILILDTETNKVIQKTI